MKSLSPGQTLVFLVLIGLALSGWLYGIHWKRTVTGDLFTQDEMLIVRLQDQIRALMEDNGKLNAKIAELQEISAAEDPEEETESE